MKKPFRALWFNVQVALFASRHARVVNVVSKGELSSVRSVLKDLDTKYLRRNYLANNLDAGKRAEILAHHYAKVISIFDKALIDRVAGSGLILWESVGLENQHSIRLRVSYPVDNEGELTLQYIFDDQEIYDLSFSFSPGRLFGSPDETIAFVTRLQAATTNVDIIRAVAAQVHGVAPRQALASALEGISMAIGSAELCVVLAENQVAYKPGKDKHYHNYDDFFFNLGGRLVEQSDVRVPTPFWEKPIHEVKRTHRGRANKRRDIRKMISEAGRGAIISHLDTRVA